jgi:protein SCO1/2
MSRTLLLFLALLAGAGTALAGTPAAPATPAALKAGGFDPPRMAPDFTLPGSSGAPLKLSAQRGKVVLLAFGYSHCQAVCPVTLSTLRQVKQKLGAQAGAMQVVYVTVDPKRDTAPVMQRWLSAFDAAFLGGTGTAAQLAGVRKAYGVNAEDVMGKMGPDGSMSHSSFVYLIDRKGRLRALMPFGRPAGDYVHDVRVLLAEK